MDEQQYHQSQPVEENNKTRSPYADSPYVMSHTPQQAPAPSRKPGAGKRAWLVLLVLILLVAACAVTAVLTGRYYQEQTALLSQSFDQKLSVLQDQLDAQTDLTGITQLQTGEAMTPGQVYAKNVQAVVAVSTYVQETDRYGQLSTYESFGSGFILTRDGYVVTNFHVVENASSITVITADGREHSAEQIGYDATNDVALLKMEGEDYPFVAVGSSDALTVGDQVVAIGNPLGELTSTLTVGYVSAKDRIVTTDGSAINMLQTDAAINSGNSGGPLFNMYGQVIGITTAKYSGTSDSGASIEGLGFAIPMDDVIGIVEDLRDYGYVKGTYLGVMVRDVDTTAQGYGLPAGAYVEQITPGYCAEAAGLQAQDIIVELGGYEIGSVSDLTRALRKFEPGQTTTVTVYRKGSELIRSVTLDEKPQNQEEPAQTVPSQSQEFEDWYQDFMDQFFD